jgi:hypothetical protein
MKRTRSFLNTMILSSALLSQASVPGGELACTSIAVMACADNLAVTQERMELWIRQGAALHKQDLAFAKEVIDMVSPALPICAGDEHGGLFDEESLGEAFGLLGAASTAVLTIGAISMALLKGGTELFDSHPQSENGCAVHIRFDSRDDLMSYLLERFPDSSVQFALCIVRSRFHHAPMHFSSLDLAVRHADRLPRGFFYVFACDINKDGAKEFLVAGLEDFIHFYIGLSPERRTHYDLARTNWPVTLYMDLEFERYEENRGDGRQMLESLNRLVAEQWAEEHGGVDIMHGFVVTDSSNDGNGGDEGEPCGSEEEDDEEDEEEEEEEEESASRSLDDNDDAPPPDLEEDSEFAPEDDLAKVSYHVHNQLMVFPGGATELEQFMKRVQLRASGTKELMVWRAVWNGKDYEMEKLFFADMSVYSANRCFRLPFSTKFGKNRPFLPLDNQEMSRDYLAKFIVSPPTLVELYDNTGLSALIRAIDTDVPFTSSDTVLPLSNSAPSAIRALARAVEEHYKPVRMRGFQVAPTGLVTFPMNKHDCEICNDTHNNNVYVVADLKTRKFYSKCHANRSKTGVEVDFPVSLGPLSMANEQEMQPGERAIFGIFRPESSTARMVLGFAGAIFESSSRRRTAPPIPVAGSVAVHYDKVEVLYTVTLPDACPLDNGAQVLKISLSKMVLRCKGKQCSSKGKRWERPSHSSVPLWNLSFLFPASLSIIASFDSGARTTVGEFPGFAVSPEHFLEESNFFRALSLTGGAPGFLYTDRLQQMFDWCALKQKESGSDIHEEAAAVFYKARIISKILTEELMEACYRECLTVSADFAYPIQLLPRGPSTLASALWIHLAHLHGYKRVENDFYIPATDDAGRTFYRAVHTDQLMTSVCTFKLTPNLCAAVFWNGRVSDDLRRLLSDKNQFPSLPLSKRYLGYTNVVYDLVDNVALTWDQVRADPSIMPFNFLDQHFPVEMLDRAKVTCPDILEGKFVGAESFEPATPLFDGPLNDQEFTLPTILWLYALIGRMFHYVGKRDGDNWEVMVFLMGAPGSFKSSIIAIIQKFVQASQLGILGTRVEVQFPIDDLIGKLMAFMSECGGCNLERDLLKQMASGDSVRVAGKHKTAINVANWNIPLLFAGNAFLNVVDTDGSLCRRVALFPFLYMLREGHGVTDLADRIFREEGPLLLIKWNTLYLKIRSSINKRIQSLLPTQVREATRQAVMAGDSFKTFFAQEIIVTESSHDRIPWINVLKTYQAWCKMTGRKAYVVDPTGVEEQAMLHGFGVRLSRRTSPVSIVKARPRRPDDTPFRNVLEVKEVKREGEEEESGTSEPMDEEDE